MYEINLSSSLGIFDQWRKCTVLQFVIVIVILIIVRVIALASLPTIGHLQLQLHRLLPGRAATRVWPLGVAAAIAAIAAIAATAATAATATAAANH